MKKTEKQHNAPPMPESRRRPTEAIAKHFHAIGLPGHGPGLRPSEAARRADAKARRRAAALASANPPHSRQEAKKRTEEALAQHRLEKGILTYPAKKYAPPIPRKSVLDLLRAVLPKAHSPERIDFAKRMYAARVETRKANQPGLLADKRGSVTSHDPRPKGMERCELYFPQRGAVPVGY